METVYQIASIAFLLVSIISVVLGLLGKKKWQKIFVSLANGVEKAKDFIPTDKRTDSLGINVYPHSAKVQETAKELGVDKDINNLLKKFGLNQNNKE